ncbi:MAG: helix-turn-helix transcriptional regulator [Sphingopyxis sp.]|nr:helix-turn-helix transcriptional regulator [Sphingopyxis sp.]
MDAFTPDLAGKLSTRQKQCLLLVGEGYSSKEIARKLGIAPSTVDSHVNSATQLLGSDDRRKAARMLTLGQTSEPSEQHEAENPDNQFVLFRFPPLGGRVNKLTPYARMLHIVQISLIAMVALSVIMLIISGLVDLLGR